MFKLTKFLKPYIKECTIGPLFKLFEAILELLLPTIMALVINNGVINKDSNYVFKMGGLMFIMAILGFGSSMICQYLAAKASQGFGTTLRNHVFEYISSLSYKELDNFGTPSLINRITNDINQLQLAVAMLIRLVIRAPFIVMGAIVMAMILDFKLSLILIATTPIFAIVLYIFIKSTSPLYKVYQNSLDKLSLILGENLLGVRIIRAFSKMDKEKIRFNNANDDLSNMAIRVGKTSALLNPITSFVVNMTIIVILWVSSFQINTGNLSQGVIIAFVNYATQILLALIVVSNLVVIFTKASASASRINEVLEMTTSIRSGETNLNSTDNSYPLVKFEDVSFNYNLNGESALSNISLEINKGETIGIIGGTGSGKSTFVNLISRFYDVTSGKIFIQDIDIKDYSIDSLRSKISIVPQKVELFSGTIEENLRWGNENATEYDLINAINIAQASEFINTLKDGIKTYITRGGTNFSGGQRQRIAIARALVKKSDVLIMDDSSSALDFATDASLRSAIKKSSKDITTLIVSQRASTIKNSDKVIVFDDGEVAGFGNHEYLLQNCEVYKEICLSQLSSEEVSR